MWRNTESSLFMFPPRAIALKIVRRTGARPPVDPDAVRLPPGQGVMWPVNAPTRYVAIIRDTQPQSV